MKRIIENLLNKIDNIKNVLHNSSKQLQPVPVQVKKQNKF
jgi:hypothetical protein